MTQIAEDIARTEWHMIYPNTIEATEVRHVAGHVLWLRFTDGLEGELDLSADLGGQVFAPLRNPALFAQARVYHGAVAWPGDIDWAPESLHERLLASRGLPPRSYDGLREGDLAYVSAMPELSRFFGIIITMWPTEHTPPHFHARYGEDAISVTIRDGLVSGRFPRRALRMVLEWSELHADELLGNWDRMRVGTPVEPIAPLD